MQQVTWWLTESLLNLFSGADVDEQAASSSDQGPLIFTAVHDSETFKRNKKQKKKTTQRQKRKSIKVKWIEQRIQQAEPPPSTGLAAVSKHYFSV